MSNRCECYAIYHIREEEQTLFGSHNQVPLFAVPIMQANRLDAGKGAHLLATISSIGNDGPILLV